MAAGAELRDQSCPCIVCPARVWPRPWEGTDGQRPSSSVRGHREAWGWAPPGRVPLLPVRGTQRHGRPRQTAPFPQSGHGLGVQGLWRLVRGCGTPRPVHSARGREALVRDGPASQGGRAQRRPRSWQRLCALSHALGGLMAAAPCFPTIKKTTNKPKLSEGHPASHRLAPEPLGELPHPPETAMHTPGANLCNLLSPRHLGARGTGLSRWSPALGTLVCRGGGRRPTGSWVVAGPEETPHQIRTRAGGAQLHSQPHGQPTPPSRRAPCAPWGPSRS